MSDNLILNVLKCAEDVSVVDCNLPDENRPDKSEEEVEDIHNEYFKVKEKLID